MVEISPFDNLNTFIRYSNEEIQCEDKHHCPTVRTIVHDHLMRKHIHDLTLKELERYLDSSVYFKAVYVSGISNLPCVPRICMVPWATVSSGEPKLDRPILRKSKDLENIVLKAEFYHSHHTSKSTMDSAFNDFHQRQPLLSLDNFQRQNLYSAYKKIPIVDRPLPGPSRIDESVTVDMEIDDSTNNFPKEKGKTLAAFVIMIVNLSLTVLSLSLVHERLPDRDLVGPLPDILLDNIPAFDWALEVSEYIMLIYMISTVIVIMLHKHRCILSRRVFLLMSLLYLYRAITMYITVLPVSSKTYPCSPKSDHLTAFELTKRVLKLLSGFGMSVNGQHSYCGDLIYSGHTVILVLCHLFITEYTSMKFWMIHWICYVPTCLGVLMLQLSHGHYSVDIVIAYYITTRLFWVYHVLANNTSLKQFTSTNYFCREWWFTIFMYFEKNVNGVVPNEFEWPLPWPSNW